MSSGTSSARRVGAAAILGSLALLALRFTAASRLGFGDAEALYACYALHPQPVYLDHPGLIGWVARILGSGGAPSAPAAHAATAVVATLVPWLGALAARAAGAPLRGALLACVALMITPEITLGLFAMTPDLLLVVLWYAALATAAAMLRSRPGSFAALGAALATGLLAGLAFDAKASGALLAIGLAATLASRAARPHLRTMAPWAAAVLFATIAYPVIADEIARGFPMLHHRLASPEARMGLSARNVGALIGGQLLYLSPPIAVAAVLLAIDLHRVARAEPHDAMTTLLYRTTAATTPLFVLVLVSGVAEPHWLAPFYLALPLHLARKPPGWWFGLLPDTGRKLAIGSVAIGAMLIAAVHAMVLTPLAPRLLGKAYQPRFDITNDLYAWDEGISTISDALASEQPPFDSAPRVVVGPHWIVCAQLHAALPAGVFVGCTGDRQADFAEWLPVSSWRNAPVVYYVTDDRFGWDRPPELAGRIVSDSWSAFVQRGGAVVRTIRIARLVDRDVALGN